MPTVFRFRFRAILSYGVLVLCAAAQAGPPVAPTEPLSPNEQKSKFKLPPGFEIQLVASEPDIQKPMNLAFDAKGQLWVTHSIEYPFAAADSENSRDGLTVLGGIGPDGKATQVTKFADRLNIPIGILPMPNGREAIVWSIPNIWKLTDLDGDGFADKRAILYGPFDFVDTHGNQNSFRLGLDGWVYACHGFRNASKIKLKGEGPVVLEMQSGNTYRFKPDGSAIEQISWGQVNPFGMCVDSRGDLFNADCHSKPITLLLRGGYYDSFGKPHDGLGFAPMTTSDDHGSTGIAGIVSYEANHFPRDYSASMFVGNVVTNIVHRDRVQWRGSSPWVEKPEDFLTSDDWWFHPVDLQLGPDGALYICDFYNSIIGHYEVDLKHPRRDRHRGRIWRVVYTGKDNANPPAVPNIANLPIEALIERLSDSNATVRQFAINEIERRFPDAGIVTLRSRLDSSQELVRGANSLLGLERVQTLWLLWRNRKLDDAVIEKLAKDSFAEVRIHLVKALAENAIWDAKQANVVRGLITDPDPFVRRAVAEALGRHPDPSNVQPLIQLWKTTDVADTQLVHAARIALRNQLRSNSSIEQISKKSLNREEVRSLVEIALAVPTESAAWFAFEDIRNHEASLPLVEKTLTHVAKHASLTRLDDVAQYIQHKYPDDLPLQTTLFQSLFSGLTDRGLKLSAGSSLGNWGARIATKLLDTKKQRVAPWVNLPLSGASSSSPWGVRKRSSEDGVVDSLFFDSIVNGEQLTGILQSAPFNIPDQLTFWICGHNGLPGTEPTPVNHVRLRLVDSEEVIAKEFPARSDTARRCTWDLKSWAGKQGVFEAIDADTGTAYAWLGVGRFEPSVVMAPGPEFHMTDTSLVTAVQVADQLRLSNLIDPIVGLITNMRVDAPVRMAAAQAGLNLSREVAVHGLTQVVQEAAEPSSVRIHAAQLLGSLDSQEARETLGNALRTAPAALQQPMAMALSGSREGGDLLLMLIGSGRASARLLQDKPILDRLAAVSIPDLDQKINELTNGLPAADERLKVLITKVSAGFADSGTPNETGMAVFKKSCVACHRINDQGGKVGPQLDGVGNRGLERLLEDVVDPNRNVDGAFRATIVDKKDGLVVTGLKLREEGTTLVLGDNQGKEVRIRNEDIEEIRLSNLSPMPSNFADQLNETELKALMVFLLQQKLPSKSH